MKVYVAAPWKHRKIAQSVASLLEAVGFTVVSRWLAGHEDRALSQYAREDLADLEQCHALLLLNIELSEGKAFEQGYAMALDIPIVAVGRPSMVFHHLPYIWVETYSEAIAALRDIQKYPFSRP